MLSLHEEGHSAYRRRCPIIISRSKVELGTKILSFTLEGGRNSDGRVGAMGAIIIETLFYSIGEGSCQMSWFGHLEIQGHKPRARHDHKVCHFTGCLATKYYFMLREHQAQCMYI